MSWTEQETVSRTALTTDAERKRILDAEREASLPVIKKDLNKQMVSDAVKFQPVKSPGIYEAEFGLVKGALIFHFWPYGYHAADRIQKATPTFFAQFPIELKKVMTKCFNNVQDVEVSEDRDMGSWFVKIPGMSERQFWRASAIEACEKLHKALGGSES